MKLFEIQSLQAPIFKNLAECLKDLFLQLNLEITENGIIGGGVDSTHTVLGNLHLKRSEFVDYKFTDKVEIALPMQAFQNTIKTMTNYDILTMSMDDDDTNSFKIKIENPETNMVNNHKVHIIEIEDKVDQIPSNIDADIVVQLPSNLFQKLIKEMNKNADFVEIKTINNEIYFSCVGTFSERETVIKESDNGMKILHKNPSTDIVQCVYPLKILNAFTKCTHLTPTVELYLKNDYALIVKYDVGTVGELKFALSPKEPEEMTA